MIVLTLGEAGSKRSVAVDVPRSLFEDPSALATYMRSLLRELEAVEHGSNDRDDDD